MKDKVYEICMRVDDSIDYAAGNLIVGGVLDSIALVEIISEFEKSFGIEIPYEEIAPENFDSIDAMVSLVKRYV